jgi:hypothetical protein
MGALLQRKGEKKMLDLVAQRAWVASPRVVSSHERGEKEAAVLTLKRFQLPFHFGLTVGGRKTRFDEKPFIRWRAHLR